MPDNRGWVWSVVSITAVLLAACGSDGRPDDLTIGSVAGDVAPMFIDVTPQTGLDFNHVCGFTGTYLLPEIFGSGVALIDYDRDGDLDVYLIQGGYLVDRADNQPANRLFRNDIGPDQAVHFTDVTGVAGVADEGYGMGVATGDYDGDGWIDLYVTNFGKNVLYRNLGNGAFQDTTQAAGLGNDESWSTSAMFFDYDLDGDDDLFVANYVNYSVSGNIECHNGVGARSFCSPDAYTPAPDRLYRNDNGVFHDASTESGIYKAYGNGLGVTAADFDGDRLPDIYVANDQVANNLWINNGDGTFREQALIAGAAVNAAGIAEASMGVTAADVDGDNDVDLFMTHLEGETNTLYINDGSGRFVDATGRLGLGSISLPFTGFGTAFFDADGDMKLDIFVANGHVTRPDRTDPDDPYPFHQTNQLFIQQPDGTFIDASAAAGDAFAFSAISRGAAFGDIDNDGDIDIVVTNNNGPARILQNTSDPKLWVGVVPKDRTTAGVRAAIDADKPIWRHAGAHGSYLSASDDRILLTTEEAEAVDLIIEWPDGVRERLSGLPVRQWRTLSRTTPILHRNSGQLSGSFTGRDNSVE